MDKPVEDFLRSTASAAMITLHKDGTPHAVRVGVAPIDGKVWISGTQDRARTRNLRHDPRASLYVYKAKDPTSYGYLTLEGEVTILEGPDVAEKTLRLFRQMQGKPDGPIVWQGQPVSDEDFLQAMVDERRLIYEFDVHKHYGMMF